MYRCNLSKFKKVNNRDRILSVTHTIGNGIEFFKDIQVIIELKLKDLRKLHANNFIGIKDTMSEST